MMSPPLVGGALLSVIHAVDRTQYFDSAARPCRSGEGPLNKELAGRAGAGLIVFLCFLIAGLEGYDIQAFGVSAPKLIPDLGLNPGQQGWAASAAMIGLVLGSLG